MRISKWQIFWLVTCMESGMSLLLTFQPAIKQAHQDAWMSLLLAGVIGGLVAFVSGRLSVLYPGQSLVTISETILGKWLGKAIVIPYFVMWYSVIGIILRQACSFLHIALFQQTPMWVLMSVLSLLIIYVTYAGGIEAIARISEVVGPIILFTLLVVVLLNLNNVNLHNLLPVYTDSGWLNIVKGSFAPASFFGESVMLTMLLPFLSSPQSGIPKALWAILISDLILVFAMVSVIATFSILSSKMLYPFFDMTRFISVLDFIQNVDVFVVIVWILSVFVKLSMYLFISSYGTAQWLHLKTWRSPIWFIVPVSFVFGVAFRNAVTASVDYPQKYWIPFVLPVNMLAIPLLLWFVGLLRKRKQGTST
ncbi:MAG: hypothetical protein A2201_05065 [Alicyclobacillus sp. RIFOXYA1_FULL_53_8]|nr:MAG: hypothetical protein A2201_05065 [Alicyclobacillus sp. RIFOXYA1_FULL_53_8]